ncbi:DUF2330 domain-containing protein [Nocardiopsis potens]|uniref:DUF2330 domain-containing protein n=1 Tax=Nocardiopsis potens TaxID=1246458 RepID=UPI00034739D1|nr:DUF2330 domain-containing protein [Nocardiopsis potens]
MGYRRWAARAAVAAAAALVGGLGLPAATGSWACACGALLSEAEVADEAAVVRVGDGEQSVLMRLGLSGTAPEAALVLPTPAPAEVSLGESGVFADLDRVAAPERVQVDDWWPEDLFSLYGAGDAAGGAPGGVDVLERSRLGPLDVAVLGAADEGALAGWLDEEGFELEPEVERLLAPYVEQGWYYVAVRLAPDGEEELQGGLQPLRADFATDEPVYPMRLTGAAERPQSVRLYLLGEHRMERADALAADVPARVDFAGPVDPADLASADAADLVGDGAYLTVLQHDIDDPSRVTGDFRFAPAASDEPYREVVTVSRPVYILGVAGGPLLVAAGLFAAGAAAAAALLVRRRRTRTAPRTG